MAEAHIERLRRLVVCPVCGAFRSEVSAFFEPIGCTVEFRCRAIFLADASPDSVIREFQACASRTKQAADLLNEECKGAAL